jgi:uncharacterized protein YqjF (DUF2071 family)
MVSLLEAPHDASDLATAHLPSLALCAQSDSPLHSNRTERDHFLTARYRLYTTSRRALRYAQIEHPPWPLARAGVIQLRQTLFEKAGLPSPVGAPLVHYAAQVAVNIGRLI